MTYNDHLQWLITMSKHPGFKAHAELRAKELESLYPGISQDLAQCMKTLSAEPGKAGNVDR